MLEVGYNFVIIEDDEVGPRIKQADELQDNDVLIGKFTIDDVYIHNPRYLLEDMYGVLPSLTDLVPIALTIGIDVNIVKEWLVYWADYFRDCLDEANGLIKDVEDNAYEI